MYGTWFSRSSCACLTLSEAAMCALFDVYLPVLCWIPYKTPRYAVPADTEGGIPLRTCMIILTSLPSCLIPYCAVYTAARPRTVAAVVDV